MSYQMVHLEVAYRLLDEYKWIEKPEDFIMGAIAPDSVHFREEYQVQFKEASHLWNCGPRWGITTQSDKWKENVLQFWEVHKEDTNRDFLAGYCVHILTDWLNDLRIWSPFREKLMKGNNYDETYKIYGQEAYGSDQWLYQQSAYREEIMELVRKGQVYSIPGCADKEDMKKQKEHILTNQYANAEGIDISSYQYCTSQEICAFVEECVKQIPEMLKM